MEIKDGLHLTLRKRFTLIILLASKILLKYKILKYKGFFLSKPDYDKALSAQHSQNAKAIFEAAIYLKGALIKMVQIISSRVDIFPDEYTSVLSQLQDKVPPVEYYFIKKRIEEEFGKSVGDIYDNFSETPVASASLGQVHFATLKTGEEVAVKIQYPGIEYIIELDLRAVRIIVKLIKRRFTNINFDVLIGEVERVFEEELDYIQEGKNANKFRENFADDPRIFVPMIYWDYTKYRVLTLERIHGTKLFDLDEMVEKGINPKDAAYLIVESYCIQVLTHGFMHADPHPGNIFVAPGPTIIYVDFGMMKVITKNMREGIKKASVAAVDLDGYRLTQQLLKLGFLARDGNMSNVEEIIQYFMDKYGNMPSGEIKKLDVKTIARDLTYALHIYHSIQIPEDYILVGRGVSILEGIIGKLAPDVNLLQIAGTYIKSFVYSGKKDKYAYIKDELTKNIINILRAPEKIDALITQVSRGKTNFVMEVKGMDKLFNEVHYMRNQLAYGLSTGLCFAIFTVSANNKLDELSWIFLFLAILSAGFFIREMFR